MALTSPAHWAQAQFGHANLNDPRRTRRLVTLATALAQQPGESVSHLPLSPAAMEGAYRFIRSPHVRAEAIANAGFAVTTSQARDHSLLLALEDTTALTFNHASVRDELGHTNQGSSRALLAHFVLLFAPRERKVVGLAAQQIWTRDVSKRGQSRESLAILGGWKETKQTGRASIAVLWEGWFRL